MKPGDTIFMAGPKNHFRLDEGAERYVLVAGGIGITPILAMADRLKALGLPYSLHYFGRYREKMALLERIERDQGAALLLQVSGEGTRMGLATGLDEIGAGTQVYGCGPERMIEALESLAEGWPEHTLKFEYFSSGTTRFGPTNEHAFEVELRDSNLTVTVPADTTLHDVLLSIGLDVPKECGEGLCGTCKVRVLEGELDHRDRVISKAERAKGDRIVSCCSRAKAGKLALAI